MRCRAHHARLGERSSAVATKAGAGDNSAEPGARVLLTALLL